MNLDVLIRVVTLQEGLEFKADFFSPKSLPTTPLKKLVNMLLNLVLKALTCCCCCWVASVVSDSVRPHRRQPTRLPRPWDPPGKNTGVGCHFLLQCMKVKSERERSTDIRTFNFCLCFKGSFLETSLSSSPKDYLNFLMLLFYYW